MATAATMTRSAPSKPDSTSEPTPAKEAPETAKSASKSPQPPASLPPKPPAAAATTDEAPQKESSPAKDEPIQPSIESSNSGDATAKTTESSKPEKASPPDEADDVEMQLDSPEPEAAPKSPAAKPNGTEKTSSPPTSNPTADVDLKPASLSQLDLDGKKGSPSPRPDADVTMNDAPASSSNKVARDREDDNVEEPAAKRAKTEPRDEEPEPATERAATAESTVEVASRLDVATDDEPDPFRNLKGWMTRLSTRRLSRSIGSASTASPCRYQEDKAWRYLQGLCRKDVASAWRKLCCSCRETHGHCNAVSFNGPSHDVTLAGKNVVPAIWARLLDIPAEEPPKAKAPPKHNPSRQAEQRPPVAAPRPAAVRKEPRPVPPSPAARPDAEAYAVPPGGVPQVRRASTHNDTDRPKRAIHPPKSRDMDYMALQNFNKKKLPLDLQFAYEVVSSLMDVKHEAINAPFVVPVDPVALQIPQYYSLIKNPMDLGTIKKKLMTNEYQTAKSVVGDVQLIVKNCLKFNGPDHPVYGLAVQLERLFRDMWSKKEQWITKHTPAKPASDAGSGEDSEEESEDEQAASAPAAKITNGAIQQLEQRLADETRNLSQLLMNIDNPDETMIDVQRTVVNAIRKRLIEEKERAGTQKAEKPAKSKPAKPSHKAKAPGNGPSKKAAGGPSHKKGGASGPKKKRQMTQVEKDAIANGINDLDENNIARAIDIIKKDTGQSENDSGELELEIDQLTPDALHKLWDLLKKVLPGFAASVHPPAAAARDSSPGSASGGGQKKSGKPKKNKSMNAREQEARIAELERLKNQYQSGQEPAGERDPEVPLHPLREDSSDSEEE
ncbi:bromodomain-containing factor 1 [Verticillium alfalfae VaMs.102]|uniref:Bromodomain-containing factor 1 n=1 Tax=Verticillium alfalfae (strain VaMs.102 / ATCC MYA-4576 / FGSC 10136) TaxID=526221 RepID=C9SCJ8_VERA1|nr:bromodomain-containing factor 1 [Verticillium alfalfae VaMs.102]EEY16813.1 bromodomain-containing factor 1 [Verticillium alfalfae VaMs.102]